MVNEFKEKIAGEIALSADPGKTIKKWREEFGISQHELADNVGISHSVISDYESGRRKSPGVATVKKIVEAMIQIDIMNGSRTIQKYLPDKHMDCIIAMEEFPGGVDMSRFIKWISGTNIGFDGSPQKKVYGYTIVDSLKAILSLSSGDYMKIYGWSTERALIFTDVHYGRSPMVAIRAHPLTPALVVYVKPDNTDPLAAKLAELEKVPLVTTHMDTDELISRLKDLKERI